jgi:hypothetical protein
MANPNLGLLIAMAQALGPLRERVVFVGGCATGLLMSQPALADIRPTEDVDAIVEVATLAGYHLVTQELVARGFRQTMENNTPPFRWFWQRMQLDLVPLDDKVMGFSNPWYRAGFEAAVRAEPEPGVWLRHLSAPYFLATKFEAFKDRGLGDVYLSHDLEDIITVVDGRAETGVELAGAPTDVRRYVANQVAALMEHPEFLNALPGIVAHSTRTGTVLQRLQTIASL